MGTPFPRVKSPEIHFLWSKTPRQELSWQSFCAYVVGTSPAKNGRIIEIR